MGRFLKISLFGLLIWTIGFAVGCAFWPLYSANIILYKSIMIVIMTTVGMIMINLYFKAQSADFIKDGFLMGLIWFIMNLVLDLIVLVGLFKGNLNDYLIGVGIRYLCIPIMTVGAGILLSIKKPI